MYAYVSLLTAVLVLQLKAERHLYCMMVPVIVMLLLLMQQQTYSNSSSNNSNYYNAKAG